MKKLLIIPCIVLVMGLLTAGISISSTRTDNQLIDVPEVSVTYLVKESEQVSAFEWTGSEEPVHSAAPIVDGQAEPTPSPPPTATPSPTPTPTPKITPKPVQTPAATPEPTPKPKPKPTPTPTPKPTPAPTQTPSANAGSNVNADELYWLSRIISAESKGEPLNGKIAVGNVVLNRVKSSEFPNTIYGVIFDDRWGGQFEPVRNGTIYQTPTEESIQAAKLCLQGKNIVGDSLYFIAPSLAQNFWVPQNKEYVTTIGCHDFYR